MRKDSIERIMKDMPKQVLLNYEDSYTVAYEYILGAMHGEWVDWPNVGDDESDIEALFHGTDIAAWNLDETLESCHIEINNKALTTAMLDLRSEALGDKYK